MKLPQKLPGSFHFKKKKDNGEIDPENLGITYSFDCHFEGMKFDLYSESEVSIR